MDQDHVMQPTSYRLIFEGPDTNEAITIKADISEAARIADEFRELLGWLAPRNHRATGPAPIQVRIEATSAIEPRSDSPRNRPVTTSR